MNYWSFLLMMTGILFVAAEYVSVKINADAKTLHRKMVIPGIMVCLLLALFFRGNLKESTSYESLRYIVSGEAADYKKQMDLQTKLLSDVNVKDVVLPFINDVQGPLMHMPVTADPEAWTNRIAKQFYEKESVVAMPRPEWNELYGDS